MALNGAWLVGMSIAVNDHSTPSCNDHIWVGVRDGKSFNNKWGSSKSWTGEHFLTSSTKTWSEFSCYAINADISFPQFVLQNDFKQFQSHSFFLQLSWQDGSIIWISTSQGSNLATVMILFPLIFHCAHALSLFQKLGMSCGGHHPSHKPSTTRMWHWVIDDWCDSVKEIDLPCYFRAVLKQVMSYKSCNTSLKDRYWELLRNNGQS